MTQRRMLIAGNWKMNCMKKDGVMLASAIAEQYRKSSKACDVLICPPFTILYSIINAVSDSGVLIGAQDCHFKDAGAYTGNISPAMLKDMACNYTIVGHSERRQYQHETDDLIRQKAEAALKSGLKVIVCIGETAEEREAGKTLDVVRTQLKGSLPKDAPADQVSIAYEPVWAIGTGKVATTHDVAEVHGEIRKELSSLIGPDAAEKMRILYGGSVKASNARDLLNLVDVDGALVGGASLSADEFNGIIKSAIELS